MLVVCKAVSINPPLSPRDTPGHAQSSAAERSPRGQQLGAQTLTHQLPPAVGQLGVLSIPGGAQANTPIRTGAYGFFAITDGFAWALAQCRRRQSLRSSPHIVPEHLRAVAHGGARQPGSPQTQGHPLARLRSPWGSSAAQALAERCRFSQRLIFLFFLLN